MYDLKHKTLREGEIVANSYKKKTKTDWFCLMGRPFYSWLKHFLLKVGGLEMVARVHENIFLQRGLLACSVSLQIYI